MAVILVILGGTSRRQEECLLLPVWALCRLPEIVRPRVPCDAYVRGYQQLLADREDPGRKSVPAPRLLISPLIPPVLSAAVLTPELCEREWAR
jgi:hypothetical protein